MIGVGELLLLLLHDLSNPRAASNPLSRVGVEPRRGRSVVDVVAIVSERGNLQEV